MDAQQVQRWTEGRRNGLGLPRQIRLRHRKDFDAVFRKGRTWSNDLLVLRTLPNERDHNRYGFITSRRLGKAVVRNRVRRRLHEVVRALTLRQGFDCILSARTKAAEADFAVLRAATTNLLRRAELLTGAEGPA